MFALCRSNPSSLGLFPVTRPGAWEATSHFPISVGWTLSIPQSPFSLKVLSSAWKQTTFLARWKAIIAFCIQQQMHRTVKKIINKTKVYDETGRMRGVTYYITLMFLFFHMRNTPPSPNISCLLMATDQAALFDALGMRTSWSISTVSCPIMAQNPQTSCVR